MMWVTSRSLRSLGNSWSKKLGLDGQTRLPLKHWDGDVFYYNAIDLPKGFFDPGVTFSDVAGGLAGKASLDEVTSGLGLAQRVVLN